MTAIVFHSSVFCGTYCNVIAAGWPYKIRVLQSMTGYTVHTGASKKFVSGWDRIFGDHQATPDAKKKAATNKKAAKKTSRKK